MELAESANVVFDFFSDRLHFIDVTDNVLLNIKLWHCLSTFESHIYGVLLQYSRIKSDLVFDTAPEMPRVPGPQAGVDIYYYILTWDKLKKIYEKIKTIINEIQRGTPPLPEGFVREFRGWKKRADHLFAEFDTEVRNEYEHPSLESQSTGNLIMWGNIMINGSGDITAHAGRDWFATIKHEHCTRMQTLRTDLIDQFVKHFSQKPLTKELVKARSQIEENIDSILKELQELKAGEDWTKFNELLYTLMMNDTYLMKEGVPLSKVVKDKLYSAIW
ncbi:MAG: hypothetical protein ABSA06_04245 [Geobacteraceae bacterium]|jgi:hypothetical protein